MVGDTGCDPVPGPEDCQRMASEGYAQTYWVLRAIAGFQAKLNVMNDYLVSNTLSTLLDIPQIADDFAPPEPPDDGAVLTALLSASLFVLGGVGGIAGVAASFAGAAASAAVAIARSAVAKRPNTDLAAHPKATRIVENAESQAAAAGRFGRGAGAEAASTVRIFDRVREPLLTVTS